jgi:hypothetical protein
MMQTVAGSSLLMSVPTIDEVLHDNASELGHDFIAYRNHAYRVVNLCADIVKDSVDIEKIAVAAVFHDLGIWTNKTFDYIAPSVALAREHFAAHVNFGSLRDAHGVPPSMCWVERHRVHEAPCSAGLVSSNHVPTQSWRGKWQPLAKATLDHGEQLLGARRCDPVAKRLAK